MNRPLTREQQIERIRYRIAVTVRMLMSGTMDDSNTQAVLKYLWTYKAFGSPKQLAAVTEGR